MELVTIMELLLTSLENANQGRGCDPSSLRRLGGPRRARFWSSICTSFTTFAPFRLLSKAMIAVPQACRSQKTSCDYLLQGHKAEYLILVPSKYRMRLRRDSMPMAKEVKAAAITAIGGCIAAVLTGLVTNGCNQTQIEKLKEQRTKITDPAGVYLWQTVDTLNGARWKGYI